MNKLTLKTSTLFMAFFMLFFLPVVSFASLCTDKGVSFLYFNGVRSTLGDTGAAIAQFRRQNGSVSPAGDSIRYETLYNYTAGIHTDLLEVYDQIMVEKSSVLFGRYELFLSGAETPGLWWNKIIGKITSVASDSDEVIARLREVRDLAILNLSNNPPLISNYIEHLSRLDNLILEGRKLLFVAHSQGNLFANTAYDYVITKIAPASVSVVHIAPASPTLRGDYVLADKDHVINDLFSRQGFSHTATDTIPYFLLRPFSTVTGWPDISGHGLLEIYLHGGLTTRGHIKTLIDNAFNTLVYPPQTASSGFFTVTLTWNGTGDVDLHTYEPDGTKVFWSNKTGTSGFLDVDNTTSYGPEHYYATCDEINIQTGIYSVKLSNFSRAEGRTATVQIASFNGGVLKTETRVMGAATGNTSAYDIFNVLVYKNSSGKYVVNLQ